MSHEPPEGAITDLLVALQGVVNTDGGLHTPAAREVVRRHLDTCEAGTAYAVPSPRSYVLPCVIHEFRRLATMHAMSPDVAFAYTHCARTIELAASPPAAEAGLIEVLEKLAEKWRTDAERHRQYGDCYRIGEGWGIVECADELQKLLVALRSRGTGV